MCADPSLLSPVYHLLLSWTKQLKVKRDYLTQLVWYMLWFCFNPLLGSCNSWLPEQGFLNSNPISRLVTALSALQFLLLVSCMPSIRQMPNCVNAKTVVLRLPPCPWQIIMSLICKFWILKWIMMGNNRTWCNNDVLIV